MVWSAKVRDTSLQPPHSTDQLGVQGQRMRDVMVSVPSSSLSLGLVLQWCPVSTTDDIWHILDVAPNSPADFAGLLPYSDYIIGTAEGIVRGESGLGELVEDHMDRPLRLFVYNHEYDVTRELHITPTRSWGGEGALGCVLGFGALHRVPAPLHEPVQAPGETLFSHTPRASGDVARGAMNPEDAEEELFPPTEPGNLIAPAVTGSPSPYQFIPMENPAFRGGAPAGAHVFPPQVAPARHKPRHHHARDFNPSIMDDYLKEGEQKSLELEGGASGGTTAVKPGMPPPPKRAGPPPPKMSSTPVSTTPVPTTPLSPPPVKSEGENDELD